MIVVTPPLWANCTSPWTSAGGGTPSPVQAPALQASLAVQPLPSSQGVPSALPDSSRRPSRDRTGRRHGRSRAARTPRGFRTGRTRPGRRHRWCTRWRRHRRLPLGLTGFEQAPVAGIAGPGVVTGVQRGADHRVLARARPALAGVGGGARAAVVAGRTVRLGRGSSRRRPGIAHPGIVAGIDRAADHRARAHAGPRLARVAGGAARCRRCTRSRWAPAAQVSA